MSAGVMQLALPFSAPTAGNKRDVICQSAVSTDWRAVRSRGGQTKRTPQLYFGFTGNFADFMLVVRGAMGERKPSWMRVFRAF